ncbi:MAG: hypothetical protein ACREMS_09685 [Gemmatimonadaceae bacterium]
MKRLTLVCTTVVVAGVMGCSLPVIGGGSSATTPVTQAGDTAKASVTSADEADVGSPVVQVRAFPGSSVISIVAWNSDDPEFGLRTSVSRTGELVGGLRLGDHRIYMTPFYAHTMGGFKYASVRPNQLLLRTGRQGDSYSCFYGDECSPMATVGVRIPDSLLRANRDSLVVTFYPKIQDSWTITFRRDLIDAYLSEVDSVVAGLRKNEGM